MMMMTTGKIINTSNNIFIMQGYLVSGLYAVVGGGGPLPVQ
jgi:hypothetical protein